MFKLNTLLFPASAKCFDSLADAYEQAQDKVHAVLNFKRAPALDPADAWALSRLKELAPPH